MTSFSNIDQVSLRELLAFYADSGVTDALDEAPVNHLLAAEQPVTLSASAPTISSPPIHQSQPALTAQHQTAANLIRVPDETQALRAKELASSANNLHELKNILAEFDGCNLRFTAKNLVFSDGNPKAELMLIGEAPERDEDIEGIPFVGRAGKLLDRILAAIGHDRKSVYVTNIIPWRPPGNREPTPLETEICRPFIERQIELVNPKILVTLGNPPTKLILNTSVGIMRMRGNWANHVTAAGIKIPTMPTLHPAYLSRNPSHKKLAWNDWLEIKMKYEGREE